MSPAMYRKPVADVYLVRGPRVHLTKGDGIYEGLPNLKKEF